MTLATHDRAMSPPVRPPAQRGRLMVACLAVDIAALVAAVVFPYRPLVPLLGGAALVAGVYAARPSRPMRLACAFLGIVAVCGSFVTNDRYSGVTSQRGTWDRPLGPGDTATWGDGTRITLSAPQSYTPSRAVSIQRPGDRAYRIAVTVHNAGPTFLSLAYFHAHCLALNLNYPSSLLEVPRRQFPRFLAPGQSATASYAFTVPKDAFDVPKGVKETPRATASRRLMKCYFSPAGSDGDINNGVTKAPGDVGLWAPTVMHDNAAWEFHLR